MTVELISVWIEELKRGNSAAANEIWNYYYPRLCQCAARKVNVGQGRVADEDDLAQNVFLSLYRGVEQGRFPRLRDRTDLWQIVLMLLHQKVIEQVRRETRLKRGAGQVRGESVWLGGPDPDSGIAGASDDDLAHDAAVVFEEEFRRLMSLLPSASLQEVARLRVAGYSNQEIAEQLKMTTRTVERKLNVIRLKWSTELSR